MHRASTREGLLPQLSSPTARLSSALSFTIQSHQHFLIGAFITLMRTLFRVLISSVLFVSLAVAQNANTPGNTPQSGPKKSPSKALTISPNGVATGARAIHNSALVIDTHADTPGRFVDENFDLSQDAGTGYLDFIKIKTGNLGAEFFSIWVEPKANKGH